VPPHERNVTNGGFHYQETVHERFDKTGMHGPGDDSDDDVYREYVKGRKRKRRGPSKGKQAERWDAMFSRLVEFKR
jgi:hypothetical protein